ncbi:MULTISPECIES: DivIVA domain-containing protein [Tsukamurella]|uniref:DivIVA domain-containing protein n=2 Tax=Tsukamurella TaxID=2060 RepID=A0A5C5S1Y8_9ACTN|nr:DivIVA domain-containing protein [Tsukamurella columbiensis]TWS29064.1 DivIVA domain-containing protein [Tsukamurella conjunctivitidis]
MRYLTPDDVRNVAFGKPPIGKRGYNEDHVDSFLDDVESTLRDLYARLARYEGTPQPPAAQADTAAENPAAEAPAAERPEDRGYRRF